MLFLPLIFVSLAFASLAKAEPRLGQMPFEKHTENLEEIYTILDYNFIETVDTELVVKSLEFFPLGQENANDKFLGLNSRKKRDTTSKCSGRTLDRFYDATLQPCLDRYKLPENPPATFGELWRIQCSNINNKIACINNLGLQCFNNQEMSNARTNFILRQFDLSFNYTQLFGDNFVQSCPIMRDNENNIVRAVSGANKCSFSGIKVDKNNGEACFQSANLREKLEVQSARSRESLNRALCNRRNTFLNTCLSSLTRCSSSTKKNEVFSQMSQSFNKLERDLRSKNIDFSFSRDC